jgi:hypothetical protein
MSVAETHFTPIELSMHRRFFGVNARHVSPVSDAAMWHVLRELRNAPHLERFRLFLVGSRVDPGNETSDIDLVLAPSPGAGFTDVLIERALSHCRGYGLYGRTPASLIDPSFRRAGPSFRTVPLLPTTVLQTAKLLSPKVARLISQGCIQHYRRFGRFSIEYWREAGDASFYQKLPRQRFDGSLYPFLRPAIEVTRDLL